MIGNDFLVQLPCDRCVSDLQGRSTAPPLEESAFIMAMPLDEACHYYASMCGSMQHVAAQVFASHGRDLADSVLIPWLWVVVCGCGHRAGECEWAGVGLRAVWAVVSEDPPIEPLQTQLPPHLIAPGAIVPASGTSSFIFRGVIPVDLAQRGRNQYPLRIQS